jgi:hypothetical protein
VKIVFSSLFEPEEKFLGAGVTNTGSGANNFFALFLNFAWPGALIIGVA